MVHTDDRDDFNGPEIANSELKGILLSHCLRKPLQLFEIAALVGIHTGIDRHKEPAIIAPTLKAILDLLETGYVCARNPSSTHGDQVQDWNLTPAASIERIEEEWSRLDQPPGLGDVALFELTKAGRMAAKKIVTKPELVFTDLLRYGLDDMIQLIDVAETVRYRHDIEIDDESTVIRPSLEVIQELLKRDYAIAGDVVKDADGLLMVRSWKLTPFDTAFKIEQEWRSHQKPLSFGDIVWLELTDAGRAAAEKL